GFLTGMINGATGSQVMPVVPFMMSLKLNRDLFIQGINCSFTMSSLIIALGFATLGFFSLEDILISSFGIGLVFLGVRVGSQIRLYLSEKLFHNAILVMLTVMSIFLMLPILSG
ncbi:MAG: sulfite exporter TauE/SafE family protein, partial [Alphaproteobacteria bacterium]|nr:sulfite exporter TauE/SafE family protein [Alphaproteobacteria bacterium]